MKRAYIEKRFNNKSLVKIEQAIAIIDEYAEQGFSLTLRQLYYQFVARDLIPNTQREYSNLSKLISDARLCGLIDWDSIEDRTRFLRKQSTWDSPEEILETAAKQYKRDLWEDQNVYMEVWIEKDALIGVIEPVCNELRLPYIACRGYMSQSEQWAASQRIQSKEYDNKHCIILHLGDHDPSGIDMTRDNSERLYLFETQIEVIRLALNADQIRQHKPPPNPAKLEDPRAVDYIRRHGNKSWELDALEPRVISELIRAAWHEHVDESIWLNSKEQEDAEREKMFDMISNFE